MTYTIRVKEEIAHLETDIVEALAEVKAMEPVHQCNCQHDDLTPRYEQVTPDHIEPTQIQYQEINSLELI